MVTRVGSIFEGLWNQRIERWECRPINCDYRATRKIRCGPFGVRREVLRGGDYIG